MSGATHPNPVLISTSDSLERQIWENEFESLPEVRRITHYDYDYLWNLLAPFQDADSYLVSPTYYMFTGRNGLWTYHKSENFLMVCWHPNIVGQILVFMPAGSIEADILSCLLHDLSEFMGGVRLARIKRKLAQTLSERFSGRFWGTVQPIEEDILDWKYPVHILSTGECATLEGGKFKRIRNHLRHVDMRTITVEDYNHQRHRGLVNDLVQRWARKKACDQEEYAGFLVAYHKLLECSAVASRDLQGIVIFYNRCACAMALWEVSPRSSIANLFINLCDSDFDYLSELLIKKTCEHLHHNNIHYLNIGGSETAGLDFFKRKLRPVTSIDLCSVEISIKTVEEALRLDEAKAS